MLPWFDHVPVPHAKHFMLDAKYPAKHEVHAVGVPVTHVLTQKDESCAAATVVQVPALQLVHAVPMADHVPALHCVHEEPTMKYPAEHEPHWDADGQVKHPGPQLATKFSASKKRFISEVRHEC